MYVISLKRQERLDNIKLQQKYVSEPIQIFDAVKGDKLDLPSLISKGQISPDFKTGVGTQYIKREVGCYLSHYELYNKIKSNKPSLSDLSSDYTIIFEDDFTIKTNDFITDVKSIIEEMNKRGSNNATTTGDTSAGDFDIIYLGNHYNNHGKKKTENIYYPDNTKKLHGTHSYLINNKNIDKILNALKYIDMPIDNKIQETTRDGSLKVYVVYPVIVSVNYEELPSHLQNLSVETFHNYSD